MAPNDIGNMELGLPGMVLVITAGSVVCSVLFVMMCLCCKKPKMPQHKAKVVKNVVAEDDQKTNTPRSTRTPLSKKSSLGYDGATVGTGRWDDLSAICETEHDVPVKYRIKKPKPERPLNPPDVILHPSMIFHLRTESRPQSTILLRTPLSPGLLRNLPQPSTSLEELIAQHTEESQQPETPLSRYPVNRSEGVKEISKDGSILYYKPKKEATDMKRVGNLSEFGRGPRGRIRSNEEPPTLPASERKRHETPSDPGDLEGLPRYNRTSGEWDNVPKPKPGDETPPPPIPSRGYLEDEVEVNAGVSQSDWSEDMPRPQNTVQPAPIFNEDRKSVKKRAHHHDNVPQRSLESKPNQQPRSPSPKPKIPDATEADYSEPWSHHKFIRPEESEGVVNGTDNLAYSQDGNPARRDYRNVPLHPDSQRYRQNNGEVIVRAPVGDPNAMLDERQRRHQRHRRLNDLIQEDVPLTNYDPNRVHLRPGVYLRPKPYYPHSGLQDPNKRFSDASDYSDFLYERSPYYADRVNRDFDPYFFRSRWSATPDQGPDDIFVRRRNSDFVLDDSFVLPRDQEPTRQPYRRPHMVEEHYDSDVIKDQPGNVGRTSRSSGYQSQSSRNGESPSEVIRRPKARLLPTPPRTSVTPPRLRGRSYHPRLAQAPTHPPIQDDPLEDAPYRYHSPERNNRSEGIPLSGARLRRYKHSTPPRDGAPEHHRSPTKIESVENAQYYNQPSGDMKDHRSHMNYPHDVALGNYKSPNASHDVAKKQQSTPTHGVNLQRYMAPTGSPKRHKDRQPDLIENHCETNHPPPDVTVERQYKSVEKHETRDVATEQNYNDDPSFPQGGARSQRKRPSTEYGSLIDVMYRYRQNVRDSRKKENPEESPESRLRFEREKLKAKLKKELEPQHRHTKNVDMVIDTLLYLCETESQTINKRSWQRDHQEQPKSKSRPNSAILLAPSDDQLFSSTSDVTRVSSDYASIQGDSGNSQGQTESEKSNTADPKVPETVTSYPQLSESITIHHGHNYCEITIPNTAPPDTHLKEFAFPTEEELDRILKQNATPPPIPPRRNRDTKESPSMEELPPPPATPRRNAEPTFPTHASEDTGPDTNPVFKPDVPNGKVQEEVLEPPYAKVNKRRKPPRRRSLPSMHLTESEIQWLEESGGKLGDVTKRKYSKFEKGGRREPKFKSTRVRREAARYVIPEPKMSPVAIPKEIHAKEKEEEDEEAFAFDDIPVDEKTDAEDIIKAIERQMSQKTKSPTKPKRSRQNSPFTSSKVSLHSDSDMGTWSSVTSSELPPTPPRRARFHRSEGKYPLSTENTPSTSPVFMQKKRFHTPPPEEKENRYQNAPSPPIPPRMESLSPVGQYPLFQTPPTSPHGPSPLAAVRRASSVANIPLIGTSSLSTSPKILPQPAGPQFTPRKRPDISKRGISTRFMSQRHASSAPNSPASGATKHPLRRGSSKFIPKIPFMGKKFVVSTSSDTGIVPIESERRRVSRTGEIVILPEDDDYADPFDCLRNDDVTSKSPNYNFQRRASSYNPLSPKIIFQPSQDTKFYPIREELLPNDADEYDDYAVPVNSPPSLLQKHRQLSRSSENILNLRDYETAV